MTMSLITKTSKVVPLLIGLLFTNTALGEPAASSTDAVAKGAEIYALNCGRCHNPRLAQEFSAREWDVIMPHMRERGHLTGFEAQYVEAFLASTLTSEKMSVREPPEEEEVSAARGETLALENGCQGCHVIGEDGGTMGPNLNGVITRRGEDFVRRKIKKPTFNNAASTMPVFPFSSSDVDSLVEFLKSKS